MTHVSQILHSAFPINSQGCKYLILLCFSPDKSVLPSSLLGQIIQQTNDQNHLIPFDGGVIGQWRMTFIFNFQVNHLRKIISKRTLTIIFYNHQPEIKDSKYVYSLKYILNNACF